jgi:hypothetical protein
VLIDVGAYPGSYTFRKPARLQRWGVTGEVSIGTTN